MPPVISVRGKGPSKGQVSNKKTNVNELPQRRRKGWMMSKPRSSIVIGISSKVTCLLLLRHPAYRQREFITGVCTERKNLSPRCQEKTSSKSNYKKESIEACHGGGTFRSSVEAPVTGVERRGGIIQFSASPGKLSVARA